MRLRVRASRIRRYDHHGIELPTPGGITQQVEEQGDRAGRR